MSVLEMKRLLINSICERATNSIFELFPVNKNHLRSISIIAGLKSQNAKLKNSKVSRSTNVIITLGEEEKGLIVSLLHS
jgi:hypothetical protein